VHTLLKGGVEVCFANPGTSEMHFVAALDRVPGMNCVLGLQENIVTGAADGYYRVTDKPAATLLHCGPGLANGMANLHNAKRARSGIVNIVGDQATYHRPLDAPLTADTDNWARGVSSWVRTATSAAAVGSDAAVAIQAAGTLPGQIATLVLPSDTCWDEGGEVADPLPVAAATQLDPHAVKTAARLLREKRNVLVILGGRALREGAQRYARRIEAATNCKFLAEINNARHERGRGRMQIDRVPYAADRAISALKDHDQVILVGGKAPVGFFAYPNKPSLHYPQSAGVHVLAHFHQDVEEALRALAEELSAPDAAIPDPGPRPQTARGTPTPEGLGRTIAALMPEHSIVVDESVSCSAGFIKETFAAPPHAWMQIMGGAIGAGLPIATGAAVGGRGSRRIISLQADGSAMYTVQALWTQARERLPVTTIILSNRKYQVLLGEYFNVGANPGRTAMDMLSLSNPDFNWVKLAEGFGVEAARAGTLEVCGDLLAQSFKNNAPFLIELAI
jgi:acetolactate synthase-1/2/3 large subunit